MFRRLPTGAIAVALLVGALAVLPSLWSQHVTPPGWRFTGNLMARNPDMMQYRVWFRQTQRDGPIVPDAFTTERNGPRLPLVYPYLIGKTAEWLSVPPEFVYTWTGAVLAFAFVLLLFAAVREFIEPGALRWWVFLGTLLGGGLGGHLKYLLRFDAVKTAPVVRRLLWDPISEYRLFEDYRGHFVVTSLFDPQRLLNWTLCTASILALYGFLKRGGPWRFGLAAGLVLLMTLIHLYEGLTLIMVATAIAALCWKKHIVARRARAGVLMTLAAVFVCLAWQASLQPAGVATTDWHAQVILPSLLFLAYPLAWTLTIAGLSRLWRDADLKIVFLLGWALGCTVLTLSGPFYPYTDRGTVSLQIPISILAGLAFVRMRPSVSWRAALVAIFILGATPAWYLTRLALSTEFRADAPAVFENEAHRQIIRALSDRAGREDILLARQSALLWIAPEYPGRHYCAHFFLTVDFDRKTEELAQFMRADAAAQAAFLRAHAIRFVFVEPADDVSRFANVPGLAPVVATPEGSVFEYHEPR